MPVPLDRRLVVVTGKGGTGKSSIAAALSLAEIVMLGKVFWHAARETERGRPRWDMVVLDAPATGHGLTFLSVPEVFLRLVSEGPLARDMRLMQALLADRERCSICI